MIMHATRALWKPNQVNFSSLVLSIAVRSWMQIRALIVVLHAERSNSGSFQDRNFVPRRSR